MQIAFPLGRQAISRGPRWLPLAGAGLGLAILVATGVFAYQRFFAAAPPAPAGQVVQVRRGTLVSAINTTGSVAATKQAKLVFATSGRLKEITTSVGEQVKSGQTLARLHSEALQVKLEQAQSQLTSAKLKLQQLQEAATPEEVAAAQAAHGAAVAKYDLVKAGPTSADLRAAEAGLVSAQASYDQAVAKLNTLQSGTSAADLASARASTESARNSLASAEAKLEQLRSGPTPEELATAESGMEQARANLRSAEARLEEARKGPTTADLVAAQASFDQAQANVSSAKVKLDQARASASVPAELIAAEASLASATSARVAARNALAAKEDALIQARADLEAAQHALDVSYRSASQTCEQLGDGTVPCLEAKAATDKIYPGLRAAEAKVRQLEGDDAPEVKAAREALISAEAAYASAKAKYDQVKVTSAIPVDLTAAQAGYDSAVASLTTARAKLDQLKAGTLPADMAAAQASYDNARSSLVSAEAKLRQVQQGATYADTVAAETSVETARANLAAAEAKLAAVEATGPGDVASARAAVQSAQAGLESARAKLDQLKAGPTDADLESARSSLLSAEASLALKQAGTKATDLALQMESIRQAELSVQQAQVELDSATLVAPFEGVVASITGNVGEQAPTGTTGFIVLVDPRQVRVDVSVDETDVARIQAGKPGQITFDALPGRTFPGKVLAVAPSGTLTQGVVTYPVALSIETRDQVLPAGLTASVNITVDQKDNALMVPNRAVRRQGREQVVDVVGPDGKTEQRPVRTGVSNDQFTEITQGLSEGEEVLIRTTTTRVGGSIPGAGPGGGGQVFIQRGGSGPGQKPGGG